MKNRIFDILISGSKVLHEKRLKDCYNKKL